jgi:alpha-tubulin suppressor-like RCC1 family protein
LDLPAGLCDVVAITAGDSHNLALKSDRTVVAWGNNYNGQANVPATLSGVVAIAAGDQHSLALRDDGTVVVWGRIWDGQTYLPATVPPGLSNVVTVAAGALHNLALCVDTWSVNSAPQASAQWATGAAGQDLTLTLSGSDPDGDLIGFRVTSLPQRGTLYQYADGSRGSAILAPDTGVSDPMGRIIFVPDPERFGDPYASFSFVANDGVLDSVAATVMIRIPRAPFSATQAPTGIRATSAVLNGMATPNGLPSLAWFEWGTNSTHNLVTPAVDVGAGWGVVRVSAGLSNLVAGQIYHSRLVVSNEAGTIRGAARRFAAGGRVLAWGAGPLGLSGWPHYGQSVVPEGLGSVTAIAAGSYHSFALRGSGEVVGWGDNSYGQTSAPPGTTGIEALAGGRYHSVALRSDGTVVAWGSNYGGETNVPTGLSDVIDVAAGWGHSIVLREGGTVAAWGWNQGGQTNVPTGLSNVTAVAAGELHSLVLLNDGRVVAWGTNWGGQVDVPADLEGVIAIAAGHSHNLALRHDGTVVAWGANWGGSADTPPGLTNVVAIAAGTSHSLALRDDGRVVVWGTISWDSNGQVPATVPAGVSNVIAVAAGSDHDLALLGPPPLVTTIQPPGTESIMFRQTGLMWQRIRVFNSSPWTSSAVRVLIQGLLPGTAVYNASGTNDSGQPYVQYNQPLAPGASVDLMIEYFVPTRTVPNVVLIAESTSPVDPIDAAGTVQPITRSLPLEDGSYLIDFRTLANRTYYVQYSSDLTTWRTAFPPVVGSGSGMQWVDNGPPKTDSHPSTQTNRFYRVLLAP